MGNLRKYIKVMVNVSSENEQCCHEFCEYDNRSDGFCLLFGQYREEILDDMLLDELSTYRRLAECIENQIN